MIKLGKIVNEIIDTNRPAIIQQIPSINVNAIADAIYIAEGGNKTKFPYGISFKKSGIQTANKENARDICIKTINHVYHDWVMGGHKQDFIDFLSLRYDMENHENWAKMVKSIINKRTKITKK